MKRQPMSGYRQKSSGQSVILIIGVMVVGMMVSALAIDMSFMYAEQTMLQSAADAGALAGIHQLIRSGESDPDDAQEAAIAEAADVVSEYSIGSNTVALDAGTDVILGYVDPENPVYDSATFSDGTDDSNYSFTGGYNAVAVIVRRTEGSPGGTIPTLMANLFGVTEMSTQASAVAMADSAVSTFGEGLRPLYACTAQYNAAAADGNPANNVARLYGTNHSLDGAQVGGCPANPSGNWGFADFRDSSPGAPGNSTLTRWFEDGWGGVEGEDPVVSDAYYSTQPGNSISSSGVKNAIQTLIDNQTVITVPLIDSVTGGGSNTKAHVTGFAGFVITNFKSNGNQASRFIEGYFTPAVCSSECTAGGSGGGEFKLRLIK